MKPRIGEVVFVLLGFLLCGVVGFALGKLLPYWSSLMALSICLITGVILGLFKERLYKEFKKWRDIFLGEAAFLGFLLAIFSYYSSGQYVNWEAFVGVAFCFQSQLALIYFYLGEIKGRLK